MSDLGPQMICDRCVLLMKAKRVRNEPYNIGICSFCHRGDTFVTLAESYRFPQRTLTAVLLDDWPEEEGVAW